MVTEIWAKNTGDEQLTLLQHTTHVVEAIKLFSKNFVPPFDVDLAMKGAVLHDLGKAHPNFQGKIRKQQIDDELDFIHRHEISSLGFLPAFPRQEWDALIDMVVAHHKSIANDARNRGIIDLVESDREAIANHLYAWNHWHVNGLRVLEQFGFSCSKISENEAEDALWYVVDYCEKKPNGVSLWRGLLKAADHFASAFNESTKRKLLPLFEMPKLDFYLQQQRQNQLFPLSTVPHEVKQKHTLVVAPTGAGKTDFLLKRCQQRIFYTLPFQASINAMYERITETVPNEDIRLLHATSKIIVKNNIEEQILQPLVGSAVKVMTPHQMAAIIFATPGFETVMLDLAENDIILDEIHTYSDYAQAMVIEIVKALLRLNCRVHIGTATMPTVLYDKLLQILEPDNTYQVSLSEETMSTFNRHRIHKIEPENIETIIEEAMNNQQKLLIIYNTVKKAQQAYQHLSERFPDVPHMLIHSRFRREDRVKLEHKLKKEFDQQQRACFVISTQVVEVSLDISFDCMITQCAPLDSLIQRFGRVNRRRSQETIGKYKDIYVLAPAKSTLPYDKEMVEKSYSVLPNHGEVLEENSLQQKLDTVYGALDSKEIEVHLVHVDGVYTMRELTNKRKAVLLEALKIESANCILQCDQDDYIQGKWESRLGKEIPVSYRIIANKNLEQLQVGSRPFVVTQDWDHYQKFGLDLESNHIIL